MLEKDHFQNSSCIHSEVKSKADYLEIRFLSFTAVTPAGTLGLCISEQGGRKEPPRPLVPHWPLCLPALQPFLLGSGCCVAMAGSAASAHSTGFGGTASHP